MRIAIVSMSTGSGHVRAAKAIESYVKAYANHEIMHIDAADYIHPILVFFHIKIYAFLSEYIPKCWGFLYRITNHKTSPRIIKINNALQNRLAKKLHKKILDYKPDVIICTYFGSAQLMEPLATKNQIPTYLVLTDYEAHALFVMDHVSGYFVPTEEVRQELLQYGVAKNKIHVSGIPIDTVFYEQKNQAQLRTAHNIAPTDTVLLIIAKTYRTKMIKKILNQVKNIPNLSVLIIGKQLDIKTSTQVKNVGWTKNIEEYMRVADLVITKSGGLISTECMILGKYMIIFGPIPGQESANADYIEKNGCGLLCKDIKIIYTLVKACISMPRVVAEKKNLDQHPCKKIFEIIS